MEEVMKKLLLFLLVSFLSANVFAVKNKVVVKSGDLSVLKETANTILEMDYNGTTWEDDDDYKEWSGDDYDERVRLSESSFTRKFNATSNGLKINGENAKYKIVFKVTNLEQHTSWFYKQKMSITGTIEVIDIATGKSVLLIDVIQAKGSADYTMTDRIKKAFADLTERLFMLKQK